MEKKDEREKKAFYTQWLEKMQQESWQLELLISGLSLAGVYNLKGFILDLENIEIIYFPFWQNFLEGRIFHWFLVIVRLGWVIFMVNLLVHILVRALWISAIGLRYVSGDISYENLDYSNRFTRFYQRSVGSFDDYIEKLERYSSLIFSFSFLSFFIVLSLLVMLAEVNVLFWFVEKNLSFESRILVVMVTFFLFLLPAALLALDFITLGRLKRIKDPIFSTFFYYLTRAFSFFSLSFLYRPLMLNFIDSGFARWFYWMTIPYVLVIALVIPNIHVQSQVYFPSGYGVWTNWPEPVSRHNRSYDDLRKQEDQRKGTKSLIGIFSLANYKVKDGNLEFFVRIFRHDNKLIRLLHPEIIPVYKEGVFFDKIQDVVEKFPDSVDVDKNAKILVDTFTHSLKADYRARNLAKDEAYFRKLAAYRLHVFDSLDALNEAKRQRNFEKVRDAVMGFIRIKVDGQDVNERTVCHFTVHPDTGEEGLSCYCRLDSLETGVHQLSYERKFHSKLRLMNGQDRDTFYVLRHAMPFLNLAD